MSSAGSLRDDEIVSLENCAREPVHIPGRVQTFAVLLGVDAKASSVKICSANAADLFGMGVQEILGSSLSDLLGKDLVHTLRSILSLSSCRVQREHLAALTIKGVEHEIWVHLSGGTPVLEFERSTSNDLSGTQAITMVRSLLGRIQTVEDLDRCLSDAVSGLRGLTGFDRVVAYRFDRSGDGEVIAESCGSELESFLGLRFPKWDVPSQAREIMTRLPLRVIADLDCAESPLIAATNDEPPLDLTLAASRGTSPIHTEYLRNMGLRATMTLSIVSGGRLWGLFAFHNSSPFNLGPGLRSAAELFVQFFSLQLDQRLAAARNDAKAAALSIQKTLVDHTDRAGGLPDLMKVVAADYCAMLDAQGLALVGETGIAGFQAFPDDDTVGSLSKQLLDENNSDIGMTNSIKSLSLDGGECAGALAVRLDAEKYHSIIFFRHEAHLSLNWAGAPKKEIVSDGDGVRLKPRGSFEAYTESVKDSCLPWEEDDIVAAREISAALEQADSALNTHRDKKEARQRTIYIAELNHRVRNIIALIRSLSRRAQDSTDTLETYAKALEQRIAALAVAHDLAANKISSGVDLNRLFQTELTPYLSADGAQFSIAGDGFAIRPDDGESEVEFLETGVKATFWLPSSSLTEASVDPANSELNDSKTNSAAAVFPSSLFVLEDSMMVAMEMAEMLRGFGAAHVQTSATVAKAKIALAKVKPDFAVLDISLRDEESFEIAFKLLEMNVPFIFVSGFGSNYEMPKELKGQTILTKPVEENELKSTIMKRASVAV